MNIRRFIRGELVGADDDGILLGLERPEIALFDGGIVVL